MVSRNQTEWGQEVVPHVKGREGEEREGMWSGSRERRGITNTITRIFVKPIFHCDAKTLTLGRCIGQYPHRESFALGVPTCWYLKTLKFVLSPNANA